MGRHARKTFSVNGSEYAVDMMVPTTAFKYGLAVSIALAPVMGGVLAAIQGKADTDSIVSLFRGASMLDRAKVIEVTEVAWQCVVLPDRTLAKNPGLVDIWFAEHPADMFPVAALSVWKLVEDFFPQGMITAAKEPASSPLKA